MFKLFVNNNDDTRYPIKKYTKFDYIKRRYLTELTKVKDYYRNKERAVDNKHLVSRLVNMLTPSLSLDIYDYLKVIDTNARFLSRQFGIVSNIHSGVVMDNIFFGKNSKEILLYKEHPIDLDHFEENWMNYTPVKVIYTDSTDLNMDIPFNNKQYFLPVLNIMSIDIVVLMLQYYKWANNRMLMSLATNTNIFISQIVLPNMLDNMLDLAIYNRFMKLSEEREIPEFKINHPFHVLDLSPGVDKILLDIVKDLKSTNIPVMQILQTIPTITNVDMYDVLFIDHKYYTKQSEWVLLLSRIYTINDLVRLLGKKGMSRNKDLLNKLPVYLKAKDRARTIEGKLPDMLNLDFIYELSVLKKKVGHR